MDNNAALSLPPFKEWLFHDRRNRIYLRVAAVAIIIQFVVFKYFYPYASFIHDDSFTYLTTAYDNLDINTHLVGYSKFLRLFSVFSSSDTALTAFQFLLIQGSALFFLFTLLYFYKPGKVAQIILLCFMVLNPLFLHLANLISSDALFLTLSLIWFSLLIWIIYRASTRVIVWHAVVLFIAFTVRYNALIYPFISAGVFLFAKLPWRKKIASIAVGSLLCGLIVLYTSYKYKVLTGTWQYSPFSGWQLANNAMYAYRYVDSVNRKKVPAKFEELDNMIRAYFDSTRDVKIYPWETVMASTFYMWSRGLPLFKYRNEFFKKDTSSSDLKKWASMGPIYKAYGLYIIKQYPLYFIRYFIWPNANKYYAPPVEFLSSYNSGKDSVLSVAQNWFGYSSRKVTTRTKGLSVSMLDFYPIISGVINVVMLCSLLFFMTLKGGRISPLFCKGVLLAGTIWVLNAGFTIFASSAALRFQSFPIMLTFSFAVLLVDWLWKISIDAKVKEEGLKQGKESGVSDSPGELLA